MTSGATAARLRLAMRATTEKILVSCMIAGSKLNLYGSSVVENDWNIDVMCV